MMNRMCLLKKTMWKDSFKAQYKRHLRNNVQNVKEGKETTKHIPAINLSQILDPTKAYKFFLKKVIGERE